MLRITYMRGVDRVTEDVPTVGIVGWVRSHADCLVLHLVPVNA